MALNIYSRIPQVWGAIHFYRFLQPLTFMERGKLCQPYVDFGDDLVSDQIRANAMQFCDINWQYQNNQPTFQQFLEGTLKAGPFWRTEDHWDPPVNMVIDTDDDLFNISPLNKTAFARMGTRYQGVDLERGCEITGEDAEGKKITLWRDGQNINIGKNRQQAHQYRHNLSIASLVTCATPGAQAAVLREAPSANTYVNPNCIDLEDYGKIELGDHSPTVRILWQGGDSHLEDMFFIRDSLTTILKKYPFVELVIWGAHYVWPEWPAAQVKFQQWAPYQEYKLRLNQMNHDINLAPLVKHPFNDAKSSIKVYESAACWRPAPTVAQRTGPYCEFDDGITAMLYDTTEEFEAKLSALIENEHLRKSIASNCKDWIATNRDPMTWAHRLAEQFEALRTGRRAVTNPPPKPVKLEVPDAECAVPANLN